MGVDQCGSGVFALELRAGVLAVQGEALALESLFAKEGLVIIHRRLL
jgi:hypothetical protein